jgi:hypothetical protein
MTSKMASGHEGMDIAEEEVCAVAFDQGRESVTSDRCAMNRKSKWEENKVLTFSGWAYLTMVFVRGCQINECIDTFFS